MTVELRKELIARHVAQFVNQGWLIESQSFLSSVLTRGRWLTRRKIVSVDEGGRLRVESLPPRRDQVLRLVTAGAIVFIFVVLIVVRAATS